MKLSNKLLPLIAISCLLTTQSHAADLSSAAKTEDYIIIEKAGAIVHEFCRTIQKFFDTQNTESFNCHLQRFAATISSIDCLTNEIQERFNKTSSVKDKAFLEILNDLRKTLNQANNALRTRKLNKIALMFNNCLSEQFIHNAKTKLENAKKYLTENEINLVNCIIGSTEQLLKNIPVLKNHTTCAAIISKRMRR